MIRTIFSLFLFLSSCSFIEVQDIPAYSRVVIFGVPDIEVSNEYYKDMPYSFAKIKLGRSKIAILSLLDIHKEVYIWIAEDGTKIYTKNGKIIQTLGLDHDINHLTDWNYLLNLSYYVTYSEIQLSTPRALINQKSILKYSHDETISLERDYQTKVFLENFNTVRYRWADQNTYWVSEEGRVLRSIQKIHPDLGRIEITFFYKKVI